MSWKKSDILALMCGHGKSLDGTWDSGCVYGKYTEADLMLKITKVAVKYLRLAGVKVLTDADNGNNRNMKSSVAWANSKGCKLYMSLHCDYKLATAGVAPLFKSATGKKMATTIGRKAATLMGMKWKGAFKRTDLYELNATNMPAVIFEAGAIKADLKYLKQYAKYGKALAKAICKYIGVKFKEHSNAYRLRVSAKAVTKYMKQHKFKYVASWTKNALTWAGAKKKRTTNCSTMVCYALQRKGLLKSGEYFWINGDDIVCKGGLTLAKLKKIATISHPHKAPKKAGLKAGDICGYTKNAHTQIFDSWTASGNPRWYSTGGNTDISKGKAHVKSSYNNKKVMTIIRLK